MTEQKVPGPGTEGQAPYGAEQGGYGAGAPGWGAPPTGYGAPQPPTGGSGLAITALVLGAVSLLMCWVPIVNNLFAVTAIAALVLGLVAARRAKKGRSTGRGTARAGWILGTVALVGVIATQAFYASVLNDVSDEIDRSFEEAEDDLDRSLDEVEDELDGDSAASEDDAQQLAAAEESDAVLAIGQPAEVGDYDVVVTGINTDADGLIAAENSFNEPPAGRYVLLSLAVTYTGADEGTPWVDLSTSFVGSDARNYGESSCNAVAPNEGYELPTLTQGGQATYDVCFDVPLEALASPQVYVEETFSFDDEGRVFWSVD